MCMLCMCLKLIYSPTPFYLSKALSFHLLIDRILSEGNTEGKYYNPEQCNNINNNNNKYKL